MPRESNSCILRLSRVKDLPPLLPLSSPISAYSSPHQAVSQTDIGTSLTGGSDIPKNQLLIQIQCSPESPRVDFTVITPGLGEGGAGTNGREGGASLGGGREDGLAWGSLKGEDDWQEEGDCLEQGRCPGEPANFLNLFYFSTIFSLFSL